MAPTVMEDMDLTKEEEDLLQTESDLPEEAQEQEEYEPNKEPETETGSKKDEEEAEEEETPSDFEAFKAKHKDKSPEQLLEILHNQTRATKSERQQARQYRDEAKQTNERLAAIVERINRAREEAISRQEAEAKAFDEQLRNDPDAATRNLHDRLMQQQTREEQQRLWSEFLQEQSRLAREAIPDFETVSPRITQHAVERLGYTPQEVAAASDHRDLVMAFHSMRLNELVEQGVLDKNFNPTSQPQPQQQQDPRLARAGQAGNAPRTLSSTRGQGAQGGAKSLQARADEIAAMSDGDFSKLKEDEIDALLRELHGE